MGPRITTPPPPPRPASMKAAAGYLLVALFLFAGTLWIPHFPALYGSRARGSAELELVQRRAGEWKALSSPASLTPDAELGLRYAPAGFLYLWAMVRRPDGQIEALIPQRYPPDRSYGLRADSAGGVVPLPRLPAGGVILGHLSPVPQKLAEIRAAFEASPARDPREVARELSPSGVSRVFVVALAKTATATAAGPPP
ncbi:MAG: hypothetical protein IT384_32620 [Deltaproteobacteria bacterium]|nr:hypothetical protein [Deltaproteobacteria bacterium]